MLIGTDYPKIEFDFLGLHLLEPNALIGDAVLLLVSIILGYKTHLLSKTNPFFINWKWFFIVLGIGFFLGGLGHVFYNYFGLAGKYPSWYSGFFSSFFAERAMVTIFPNQLWSRRLKRIVNIKLAIALVSATLIYVFVDLNIDPSKGLIIPTINYLLGLGLAFGLLGVYYQRTIFSSFKYLWIGTLVLIPSTLFQSMKINFSQYFDRNDVSHILLIVSMLIYYQTLKGYRNHLDVPKLY